MMLKLGLFVLVVLVAVVNCYPAEDLIGINLFNTFEGVE